jgi:hypothetical protein
MLKRDYHMTATVARALATHVAGLLETTITKNPQQKHTAVEFYQPG